MSHLYFIFSIIFLNKLSCPDSQMLWDHGGNNPWEKPGTSSAKTEWWLVSPEKPRFVDNMHSSYELSNVSGELATCSST